ncbi:hypothetical protein AVEN_253030-1 [Araneus ventricosus]|uniref:Uncharacterized protein n=1 Tax=Araneus ventricosus TaxID=182803 RepID=A0A4Y2H911_ARAVE|nr:hypothetical protein AVEN_253030-1 [Araneus ventricosus]
MVTHRHSCESRLIGTRFEGSPFSRTRRRKSRREGNCRNIGHRKSSASNAWPANCARFQGTIGDRPTPLLIGGCSRDSSRDKQCREGPQGSSTNWLLAKERG